MSSKSSLLLASKSPRRRELLRQIGVSFNLVDVSVLEQREAGEAPQAYVMRLAESKARAGAAIYPDKVVLGADTIVVAGETVLEKPAHQSHALEMLKVLSGATHQVMTAVSLCCNNEQRSLCNTTQVSFRKISEQEARLYWNTREPLDKAGGYGIQGFGGVFVESINGSYSSVVGLPLYETSQLLAQFGVPFWNADEINNSYE